MESSLIFLLSAACLFFIVAACIDHFSRNSQIPSVGWMMGVGMLYGAFKYQTFVDLPQLSLDPTLVLFGFLPILIFDSAHKINVKHIAKVGVEIVSLATIGVLITAIIIAGVFSAVFDIPFIHTLLFGSIIASSDPIAVASIFKNFKLPHKLHLIIEGESLVNDATSIVMYTILSGLIFHMHSFSFASASLHFVFSIGGAVLVGALIAMCISALTNITCESHNKFISTVTTFVAVYGTFIVAEHYLHVSGVIAVATSGIILALQHKKHKHNESEETYQHFENDFWDVVASIINYILFFILGIEIGGHIYDDFWGVLPVTLATPIIARSLVIYGLGTVLYTARKNMNRTWQHVINIAGIRGALSVALILLLPKDYEHYTFFLCATTVIVFFSVIVNSVVMKKYLDHTKF